MYVYNYRIYDRYNKKAVSLAVLTDTGKQWRPRSFGYSTWGFQVRMRFPTVKLSDYEWNELEQNPNPFSIVVMAHLKTQATQHDPKSRLDWKLRLIRMLYERKYAKKDILELFRFIDWLEESKMPYVTSIERIGIEKGLQQGMNLTSQF